jgi:hypothetical protein
MRKFLIGLALAVGLFAQEQDHYVATASTTALTLQQPASNARQITFGSATVAGASVYCASASTATISWNGSVSTATAGTELKLPGTQRASGMTVWTATNQSSAGTTGPVYNVPAGLTYNIDLTWFRFGTQGTGANITITTSNSCTITFAYSAV